MIGAEVYLRIYSEQSNNYQFEPDSKNKKVLPISGNDKNTDNLPVLKRKKANKIIFFYFGLFLSKHDQIQEQFSSLMSLLHVFRTF